MLLYEASWTDRPSLLLCAQSAGEAIQLLHQHLELHELYQLHELNEILPDDFLLVKKCGKLHAHITPPYNFCPDSKTRIFRVQHVPTREESVCVVSHISELPALVLWHHELITDEEFSHQALILSKWENESPHFSLLEVDTTQKGILLRYEYCCCPLSLETFQSPHSKLKKDLE